MFDVTETVRAPNHIEPLAMNRDFEAGLPRSIFVASHDGGQPPLVKVIGREGLP